MGLQHTAFKEWVMEPGLLSQPNRRPWGALQLQIPVQLSKGGYRDEQGRHFSEMHSKRTRVTIKERGKRNFTVTRYWGRLSQRLWISIFGDFQIGMEEAQSNLIQLSRQPSISNIKQDIRPDDLERTLTI